MLAAKEQEQKRAIYKLFNFRPVLFAAIFLCLGIIFSYFHKTKGVVSAWSLLVFPAAAAVLYFSVERLGKKKTIVFFAVLCISFFVGSIALNVQLEKYSDTPSYNGEYTVIGKIVGTHPYANSQKVLLSDLKIDGERVDGKLTAYLPTTSLGKASLSDVVILKGELRSDIEYFNEYGFAAEKIHDDIRFQMKEVSSWHKTGEKFDLFLWMQNRWQITIHAGMDETPASVTIALLTGDTAGIENGLLDNIRYGGIAHIFAVSGLHVGALFGFCLLLEKKTKLRYAPKLLRFLLLAVLLLFYAGVCGFSASIIRATTLCLVTYAATLIGTKTDFLATIGLSAIVVLLLSPVSLFEIGFQLSFTACLGLALFTRPIREGIEKGLEYVEKKGKLPTREERVMRAKTNTSPPSVSKRIQKACIDFLSGCIAAQLATAPIQMQVFGYLSVWSLLLNCIFVPLVSAVFSILLAFIAALSLLPSFFAATLLYASSACWSLLLLIFEAADFSSFAITGLRFSFGAFFTYYAGLLFFTDKWNLKKQEKVRAVILCFVIFVATMVALNI